MMNSNQLIVIKLGGEIIHQPDTFNLLCGEIAKLKKLKINIVLVHGGGQQVNLVEAKLGNTPTIIHGRRVTDESALDTIKMVIAGKINIEIVSALLAHGVSAVGLTGVDDNMLHVCRRPVKTIDYGFVGDIQSVNPKLILNLLANDLIPVIAPLAADENGKIYNINADTVASAIALSINATQWVILSNIDGVYDENGTTLSHLSCDEAKSFIASGVITDGMIPKIESIISAIQSGLKSVHLINGLKPEKLAGLFLKESLGTLVTN